MHLISLLAIFLIIWALTNFILLPRAKNRWIASTLAQKVSQAGALAVIERIRDLAMVGAITLAAIGLLVLFLDLFVSNWETAPRAVIVWLSSIFDVVKAWTAHYSTFVGLVATIGCIVGLIITARNAKKKVAKAWTAEAEVVLRELHTDDNLLNTEAQGAEFQEIKATLQQERARLAQMLGKTPRQETEITRQQRARVLSIEWAIAMAIALKRLTIEDVIREPEHEAVKPEGRWAAFARIVSTERFAKDIGLLQRPLSFLVTALLLVSLTGWTAAPLASSLRMSVNNLRINAFVEDVNQATDTNLSAAISAPRPEDMPESDVADSDDEIETASQLLANQVTEQLLQTYVLVVRDGEPAVATRPERAEAPKATVEESLRQANAVVGDAKEFVASIRPTEQGPADTELVRAAILGREDAPPPPADAHAAKLESRVVAGLRNPDADPGLHALNETVKEKVKPIVAETYAKSPHVIRNYITTFLGRYSEPVSPTNISQRLAADLWIRIADLPPGVAENEVPKQIEGLLKKWIKSAGGELLGTTIRNYATEAIVSAARVDVQKNRPTLVVDTPSTVESLVSRPQSERSGYVITSDIAHANEAQAARRAVQSVPVEPSDIGSIATEGSRLASMAELDTQMLNGFDDLFPPSSPGGGGGNAPSLRRPATSFNRMIRSSIARGVVIGRDLPNAGTQMSGLRWSIQGSKPTRLQIDAYSAGKWHELGTFDAAVVNQAIRYAADGRVMAATIMSGDHQLINRVYEVHPALIDTPLGCRVIEADRIADTFSPDDQRDELRPWVRAAVLAETLLANQEQSSEEDCETFADGFPSLDVRQNLKAELERFVHGNALPSAVIPGSDKATASREVLQVAFDCGFGAKEDRRECLCGASHDLPARYWMPQDMTSQLREANATLTPDLKWIRASSSHLEHMEFQVLQTYAIYGSDAGRDAKDQHSEAMEFPPDEIRALRAEIVDGLPHLVEDQNISSSYDEFIRPLEDFIVIQRLARAGLDGDLGPLFPAAKLARLERETRAYVPKQATIRWDAKNEVAFVNALAEQDSRVSAAYARWIIERSQRGPGKAKPTCDAVSL